MTEVPQTWEEFAVAVASSAHVPVDTVERDTRLDHDLDLDSLALAELIVMLIVEFDMETLADDLEGRNWSAMTVGGLYEEYRSTPGAVGG
jgi:acyl carrier protein